MKFVVNEQTRPKGKSQRIVIPFLIIRNIPAIRLFLEVVIIKVVIMQGIEVQQADMLGHGLVEPDHVLTDTGGQQFCPVDMFEFRQWQITPYLTGIFSST